MSTLNQLLVCDTFMLSYIAVSVTDAESSLFVDTEPNSDSWTLIGNGSWSARANGAAALMRPSIELVNE